MQGADKHSMPLQEHKANVLDMHHLTSPTLS